MEIINLLDYEKKEEILLQLKNCEWGAGVFLADLVENNKIFELCGKDTRVYMMLDNNKIVSFLTLANYDDIQPTIYTPWIGFVYTAPSYRGNRYSQILMRHAEGVARENNYTRVFVSTNHIGLYEKYGYEFFDILKDIEGNDSRVYKKELE